MAATVHKQPQLPLKKTAALTLSGMRVRLRQNILTLITIAMAVAFVTHVWIMQIWEPAIHQLQQAATPESAEASRGPGMAWLILLSLLMAAVGIANAILMSVTERYREIGTMKCLGALDSFILTLFMLESAFLGAAGSFCGALIGTCFATLTLVLKYGQDAWATRPTLALLGICATTFAAGILMTALAALYPARKASHMDPVAAMRTEI